jgi:uncharacterized protein with ParB-like and HNH nuclease domain
MISSAVKASVSDLFNPDNRLIYFVPKYQREYVWGKSHWESLFDDIVDNESEHFLGSIICIGHKPDNSLDPIRLELIDGQQRMTTLSLLLLALYVHLRKVSKDQNDNSEDLIAELINLKHKLILKSDKKTLRLLPSSSGENLDDFEYTVKKELGIDCIKLKPSRLGLRRINLAYKYFSERLGEVRKYNSGEESIFDLSKTLNFLKKVNSALIVKVEVDSLSDAFTLFETLNHRGTPLMPVDLIKNSFLNHLEKENKGSIDKNYEKWLKLINNLTDDYKYQERFLRHFYNAYKNDKSIAVPKKQKATRSNIIDIYTTLIKLDASSFFDKLYNSSEYYNRLINLGNESNSREVRSSLIDLYNISAAPSYVLLLYVFEKLQLSDNQKVELIDYMVKFFVVRHITNTPPTRDLDNIFIEVISMLHNNNGYDFELISNFLKEKTSGFDNFKNKLSGSIYDENSGATRFILCKIEDANGQTKERFVNLWERDSKKKFIWTIEHIFPQGSSIPSSWVEMIASGDQEYAEKIQDNYVHTIGNLTLTGYNSNLGNLSFEKKRDKKNKEGSFIGYKNGLFLNEELKDCNQWDKSSINNRSHTLVEMAIKLFNIYNYDQNVKF